MLILLANLDMFGGATTTWAIAYWQAAEVQLVSTADFLSVANAVEILS